MNRRAAIAMLAALGAAEHRARIIPVRADAAEAFPEWPVVEASARGRQVLREMQFAEARRSAGLEP